MTLERVWVLDKHLKRIRNVCEKHIADGDYNEKYIKLRDECELMLNKAIDLLDDKILIEDIRKFSLDDTINLAIHHDKILIEDICKFSLDDAIILAIHREIEEEYRQDTLIKALTPYD